MSKTPIFTAPDIHNIIAALPPSDPQDGKSDLTQGGPSGHLLVISQGVAFLQREISKQNKRVALKELLQPLASDQPTSALIRSKVQSSVLLSHADDYVVPASEAQAVYTLFLERARNGVVNLEEFAGERNVSLKGLEKLITLQGNLGIIREDHKESSDGPWYFGEAVVALIRDRLQNAIRKAHPSESVSLSAAAGEDIPAPILLQIVRHDFDNDDGTLEIDAKVLKYSPSASVEHIQAADERLRVETITRLSMQLEDEGYCFVDQDALNGTTELRQQQFDGLPCHQEITRDILARHSQETSHVSHITISRSEKGTNFNAFARGTLIIKTEVLRQRLEEMTAGVLETTEREFCSQNYHPPSSNSCIASFVSTLQCARITECILSTAQADILHEAIDSRVVELVATIESLFYDLVGSKFIQPLQLYAAGIETVVSDDTLKFNLEHFILDYARQTLIPDLRHALENPPSVIVGAGSPSLLLVKSRVRDFDRLQRVVSDSQTLDSMKSNVLRIFGRMEGNFWKTTASQGSEVMAKDAFRGTAGPVAADDSPSSKLMQTRILYLRSSCNAVQGQSARASDVLQHLIWVLLARQRWQTPALFVSSGKDTSRMLKQFANWDKRVHAPRQSPPPADFGQSSDEGTAKLSFDDRNVAKRLCTWRDKIKAGQDTKEDLGDMRDLMALVVQELESSPD